MESASTSLDVVTCLFTDIEGSTEKWEEEPKRMSLAVARHDALLRAAIEGHRGRVIKSTGDGVYAIFADPVDGVRAVVAIQKSVADPAATAGILLLVRCGLHAGPAEQRDEDFFGTTINRAARIMGLCHGGQMLVSRSVAERAGDRLPGEIALHDLGDVRLKGMAGVERVFQVVHPDLRQAFPALRSLEATPNNIPQDLTSFIGRERELAAVVPLLQRGRLLTLLGIGGIGKTRLALRIASDALDAYRDGAWFVDLAPLHDGTLVANEVAKVLGVREEPGRTITQTLCAHLRTRQLLLLLDNCEHLIQPVADVAHAILRAAPDIHIVATSREPLRVVGEQTYPVQPLPVPEQSAGLAALSQSSAVRLFVERVQQHRPSYSLDAKEGPAVAELIARLEGIPFAIELAAARMRLLTVPEINARLKDRFKLLSGGGRAALGRQQTLRTLIDWSYELLQDEERVLLRRLCVFADGFDLDAAERVCGVDPLAADDILDLLSSLVDKSLVMGDERDGHTRYRMLETIREYGQEKLEFAGESAASKARHCEHYFAVAKLASKRMRTAEQAEGVRRLESELDNLRASIAVALAGGVDPFISVKLAVALMPFWIARGYLIEGRGHVEAALALPAVQGSDLALAHALYVGAALAGCQGDHAEARRALEKCLALRRGLGTPVDIAATLSSLAEMLIQSGNVEEARIAEEEALQIFRGLGDRQGEVIGLLHLGSVFSLLGDEAQARQYLEQGIVSAHEWGFPEVEAECELGIGQIALDRDRPDEAVDRFTRAVDIQRHAADKRGEATALWWLGRIDLAAGRAESARIRLGGALRVFHSFGMNAELVECLEDHAVLARIEGALGAAVRLSAAAVGARARSERRRRPRAEKRWQHELAALQETLGRAGYDAAWEAGRRLEVEEAIRIALNST